MRISDWSSDVFSSDLEMIAGTAMIRQMRESVKESRKMSGDCAAEFTLSVQIAGREPAVMAEDARLNQDRGAAVIDINFGCPAKRVTNKARSEVRSVGKAGVSTCKTWWLPNPQK